MKGGVCLSMYVCAKPLSRPEQRSTLGLFECGVIIMRGLCLSRCADGEMLGLENARHTHTC